jgi:hypothetical protein
MSSQLARKGDKVTSIGEWSEEKIGLLKRTLMPKGASDDELQLFLATAQRMGLDPFAQQIRAIRRKEWNADTNQMESKISIEPGIDGFRLVAHRTGEVEAQLGPYWCGPDGKWVDAWLSETPPAAARFGVLRKGYREPRWAVALWREYRQTKRDGGVTRMWTDRPAGQLAKCFSEDTEVLTDQGFQPFGQVTGRILQVTDRGLRATGARPFVQPYDGEMVTLLSDDLNFCVTPNHDMVTTHGKVPAAELYDQARTKPRSWIPRTVQTSAPESRVKDATLVLAAAYLADGTDAGTSFKIEVSRERKVEALRALGLHRDEQVRRTAGMVAQTETRTITTRSDKRRFVYDWSAVPGWVYSGKRIDPAGMLALSRRQARVFVDALIDFDGSINARTGVRRFYTSREDHARLFEVACVVAGYAVNRPAPRTSDIATKPNWMFTISDRCDIPVIRWGRPSSRSKGNASGRTGLTLTYNTSGRVWCVTVPSGEIVVRRNGFSMRCGNCAEALAWRATFPHELGGVYTTDEMAQADRDEPEATISRFAVVEGGIPTEDTIRGLESVAAAKELVTREIVSDRYREAVKVAEVEAFGEVWEDFWRHANLASWVTVLLDACRAVTPRAIETSDPGVAQAPPGETGSDLTSEAVGRGHAQPAAPTAGPPSSRAASDTNASVTGPGDTDVPAGHEPPNTEASTSPRPASSPAGRGGRRSRSEVPGRASAGDQLGEAPPAGSDPEAADQAAFDQTLAGDDAGRGTR